MKDLLLLLPNLLKLLVRLVRDPRVSRADKFILGGTILYVIVPVDFIPDLIPFVGQVDDTYLVALALIRLLNRADPGVVERHWDGGVDLKGVLSSIVDVAVHFLPKPIRMALVERIEIREPRSLRMIRGGRDAAAGSSTKS
jgi:uncharacterized membrane protein YkvA (DUF1232 family)